MKIDYNWWYQKLEREYDIKLEIQDRTRVKKVIDGVGGPDAEDRDISVALTLYILPDFANESPAIREALKHDRESERFMKDLFS
jgi:hypothetical protein